MSKKETMKVIDRLDEIVGNGSCYLGIFRLTGEIDELIKKVH